MRRNLTLAVQVKRRIFNIRSKAEETVNFDTQKLRNIWITGLQQIFEMATDIVTKSQKSNDGKVQPVSPRERQMWAHVAAHTGLVMGQLTKGYDERMFNENLAELERLVDEIERLQNLKENRKDISSGKSEIISNPSDT